ncbi:hypothetical protein ACOME3_003592 [Neoechinorhynchus agilis]
MRHTTLKWLFVCVVIFSVLVGFILHFSLDVLSTSHRRLNLTTVENPSNVQTFSRLTGFNFSELHAKSCRTCDQNELDDLASKLIDVTIGSSPTVIRAAVSWATNFSYSSDRSIKDRYRFSAAYQMIIALSRRRDIIAEYGSAQNSTLHNSELFEVIRGARRYYPPCTDYVQFNQSDLHRMADEYFAMANEQNSHSGYYGDLQGIRKGLLGDALLNFEATIDLAFHYAKHGERYSSMRNYLEAANRFLRENLARIPSRQTDIANIRSGGTVLVLRFARGSVWIRTFYHSEERCSLHVEARA